MALTNPGRIRRKKEKKCWKEKVCVGGEKPQLQSNWSLLWVCSPGTDRLCAEVIANTRKPEQRSRGRSIPNELDLGPGLGGDGG